MVYRICCLCYFFVVVSVKETLFVLSPRIEYVMFEKDFYRNEIIKTLNAYRPYQARRGFCVYNLLLLLRRHGPAGERRHIRFREVLKKNPEENHIDSIAQEFICIHDDSKDPGSECSVLLRQIGVILRQAFQIGEAEISKYSPSVCKSSIIMGTVLVVGTELDRRQGFVNAIRHRVNAKFSSRQVPDGKAC